MNFFKLFKLQRPPLWYTVSTMVFRLSFVSFAAAALAEYMVPGFVTNWFNPAWLLILAVISGILVVTKHYD